MQLSKLKIIDFPVISDVRGNLSFVESNKDIPFLIKRVYYLYDIPAGADRAGHAHKNLEQLLIVMSGKLDIYLDDGFNKRKITLDKPYQGLYLPSMIWRDLKNFSEGTVCTVLASDYYSENDYYRDYADFIKNIEA